jgi:hypothetical protein
MMGLGMGREGVFPFSPRKIAQDKVKEKLEIRYFCGTVTRPSQLLSPSNFNQLTRTQIHKLIIFHDRLGRLAVAFFSGSCMEGLSLNY